MPRCDFASHAQSSALRAVPLIQPLGREPERDMTKTERLYKIERLIRQQRYVSFDALQTELEVSRATLHRDLQFLKDRLGAPIALDRDRKAYCFADGDAAVRHELPGLWFSESELYALLLARQVLGGVDAEAMLGRHLQPLLGRIQHLLGADDEATQQMLRRIRVITPAKRTVSAPFFDAVVTALMNRRRIQLRYFSRGRGASTERVISPQRLVHYRHTWYVDAWCHQADALRRFALDAIQEAKLLEAKAKDVSLKTVEAELDAGYGVFVGRKVQWATLQVSPGAASWISREQWHPLQKTRWLEDGRYELRIPYADPLELAMDVLRYHADIEVVAPTALRELIIEKLRSAAKVYEREQ